MTVMLQVMQLEGVRFKKYVLQNEFTGIVIDQRFWTIRGARRTATRNIRKANSRFYRLNKKHGRA